MKRHAAEVKDREARRRAEDEEAAREFAELEAQLKDAEGRADKAEAKADALAEVRADLRRKVKVLNRSISRGEERLREIQETKASSSGASSSATTYTEDEVLEMESIMGDLTAQLAELSKLRKHDEAEFDRNRQAVAGFRGKYRELAEQTRVNIYIYTCFRQRSRAFRRSWTSGGHPRSSPECAGRPRSHQLRYPAGPEPA